MNPYSILGIKTDANKDEIKTAYHKLAKKYHPDKNKSPESIEKFKEINEAYKTLTSENADHNNFPDIFSEMFSGIPMGHMGSMNPMDFFADITNNMPTNVEVPLGLTLEQLHNGGKFNVNYTYKINTGKINKKIRVINIGAMKLQQEINEPETESKSDVYVLELPKDYNIDTGPIIVKNIHKGINLCIIIVEIKHEHFKRSGKDILLTLDITLKEALIGFTRKIKLLDLTEITLNSDNIVNPYDSKTVKGKGIKNGDLIISFKILFPKELSTPNKNIIKDIL